MDGERVRKHNFVKIKLPRHYSKSFQAHLVAAPNNINLKDVSTYYYEIGYQMALKFKDFKLLKVLKKIYVKDFKESWIYLIVYVLMKL